MIKWLIESENECQVIYIRDTKKGRWICWSTESSHALMFDTEEEAAEHLKSIGYEGRFKIVLE